MIDIDITMPIHIINVLILIAVMNAVLYRPIRAILAERQKKLASLQNDVETFEKNSKLRLEEFEKKLAEARNKAKDEFEKIKVATHAETSVKVAEVRKEADTFKAEKLGDIQAQFNSAQLALQGQLDGFASEMAEKILGRAISS